MFLLLHTWGSNLDNFFVVKYESFNVVEKEINELVQFHIIQIIRYFDNQIGYQKKLIHHSIIPLISLKSLSINFHT